MYTWLVEFPTLIQFFTTCTDGTLLCARCDSPKRLNCILSHRKLQVKSPVSENRYLL